MDKRQWKGWVTDASAAEFLNNAYMNNVCRIASGELGKRLASQRSSWSFAEHKLNWVGKAALWSLVKGNEHISSIDLSGNAVGPGSGPGEADVDSNGLASLFASCRQLQQVNLAFNQLGAFGARQLSQWVKHLGGTAALTELDLQSNQLGADGVKAVAGALRTCTALRSLNLSRNQPGGKPDALVALVREHPALTSLAVVEDDDKHLTSKAKALLGDAMRANPAHRLTYLACSSFDLTASTTSLRWTSSLPADVTLLAGVLRSNTTLTTLNLEGATIAEAERTQLGRALLDNVHGAVGHCDDFELTAGMTELRWDLKESGKARKGVALLFGLLRANRTLTKVREPARAIPSVLSHFSRRIPAKDARVHSQHHPLTLAAAAHPTAHPTAHRARLILTHSLVNDGRAQTALEVRSAPARFVTNCALTTRQVTLAGLSAEPVQMLALALSSNTTLESLVLESQFQALKGMQSLSATLPVQDLTGASGQQTIDLSTAGEVSKVSCIVIGALLAYNKSVTSLRLSQTQLGDEAGMVLHYLGDQCKSGSLTSLDLSAIGLTDRGARKLVDSILSGECVQPHPLVSSLHLGGGLPTPVYGKVVVNS